MQNPLVSIITLTYNHEKYITDCINSAISQTYQNWEMIIIDDGSTDRTPDIIKSFSDNRIKYIRQKHLGAYRLGITYNNALKEAKGKFIAVLEGDDFWPTNKLEIQIPYFSNPSDSEPLGRICENIILTYGDCIITNEYGQKLFYRSIDKNTNISNNYPLGSALQKFINAENFIYAQTVMFRKETLLKIGGFIQPDYLHLVDYPTYCRLALEGEFKGIPYPLGYWRRNINSLTFSRFHSISLGFARYIREFVRQHNERIQKLGVTINSALVSKGWAERLNALRNHQNYSNGLISMIYGYNKAAARYFNLYLRQHNKKLLYSLISLLGIIILYAHLSEIIFPSLSIYFSRVLSALKKWLLK